MTLRYLAGGSYLDIMLWAHILSHRTFYKYVRQILLDLDAILPNPTLPEDVKNPMRLAALAAGFNTRSYGWMKGAFAALDGLLIPIVAPSNVDGDGAGKYFTRKGFHAWNVQGMCDADCRITYWSMRCVGSSHDSFAWSTDPFGQRLADELRTSCGDEHTFHVVADEAYSATPTVATPWPGRMCTGEERDCRVAYNYYHSAARITVERSFGLLTKRFLLLKRPYGGDMVHTDFAAGLKLIFGVCVKLVCASTHNAPFEPTTADGHRLTTDRDRLMSYCARARSSQHNMAIDRGTYKKTTPNGRDIPSRLTLPNGHVHHRRNHTGQMADVQGQTLLTSPNMMLQGNDSLPSWHDSSSSEYDASLYDPEYLRQQKPGHHKGNDCVIRAAHTAHMKQMGVTRPTPQHW